MSDPHRLTNPNDVTIDIPLQSHSSRNHDDAEIWNTSSASVPSDENEKSDIKGIAGRRRTTGFESSDKDSESLKDGTRNRIGEFYQAFFHFSIVTRYAIYVFPIGILIAIPIIVGATAAPNAHIGGVHIYWFFTWIEILWVSLWGCKVFAQYLPRVFQTLCGIVSSGTRKYALILSALEIPLTLVLWNVIALVTFLPIMRFGAGNNSDISSWESSIKNILFGLLICSLIYMGEKAIVQLISISYHRKQFDAKIKQSKRNVHLVNLLFDASRKMFPVYCREFQEEDKMIFDSFFTQATDKMGAKKSTINPLRMVQNVGHNVGRLGDKVTSAFGNVAAELTGKQVFNPNATQSIVVQALERQRCATAIARRIWLSLVVEGHDALYLEDIIEVFGPAHKEEAEECFHALDKDGNGDVSLDEIILTITEFGRIRKALNHSMHDVDQAIRVLDGLLMAIASVLGILAFLSFVTSGLHTIITAGASALLSFSFAFSSTAAEVLGSCVFLFVKHPFDIGDRVEVSDKPYIVERISLLFTVFRNVKDHRLTQIPNNILNNLWVDNFTRANAMHEQLTVSCSFDTTFAEIEALREELQVFVRDAENSRDFQSDINIEILGVGESMDKVQISVDIRHKSNWSNETVRATRRSKFMCALILAMRKLKMRPPGTTRDEEKDDENDDNNDTEMAKNEYSIGDLKTTPAAAAAAAEIVTSDISPSSDVITASGLDQNATSSGTLKHRPTTRESEAAMIEKLNTRSFAFESSREDGLHRKASSNTMGSGQSQLSSHSFSTGHRKAGTHVPYTQDDIVSMQSYPMSPARADVTASGGEEKFRSGVSNSFNNFTYQTQSQSLEQPPILPNVAINQSSNNILSQEDEQAIRQGSGTYCQNTLQPQQTEAKQSSRSSSPSSRIDNNDVTTEEPRSF
ncbi:hypothetical protein N7454_000243 [Penicillium verhagenii]|nr:hypothetical protein N7454_000243 [Penicillium verhagenii]